LADMNEYTNHISDLEVIESDDYLIDECWADMNECCLLRFRRT